MSNEVTAAIMKESSAIIDAYTLLRAPIKELAVDTLTTAWSILDLLEKKMIKSRKADLRVALMEQAEKLGTKNAKGSFVYEIPGTNAKITKQHKVGKVKISIGKLIALLKKKGIEETPVIFYEPAVNEKALQGLIAAGFLTQDDLKEISDVSDPTYALTVKKPASVEGLLKASN